MSKSLLLGLIGAVAVAGCNSSNGGGGAAGGGMASSNAAFEAARDAVSGQGATAAMPASYAGTFDGQVQAQFVEAGAASNPLGHAVGDLTLRANWTDGQAGPAFTGSAENFAGEVQGTATTWTGTLTTSSVGALNSINRFATCGSLGLPTCGSSGTTTAQRTGAVTVQMSGTLQADGGMGGADSSLLLSGFVTDDLDSMTGGAAGTFILPDGTTAIAAGQDSTWYATRR